MRLPPPLLSPLVLALAPGLTLLCAPAWAGQGVLLPSGLEAQPQPLIWDEGEALLRLRYIVPSLAEGHDAQAVADDMHWLCVTALAAAEAELGPLREQGWAGASVTLMDREVEFGTLDAASFQLFEWFVFQDGDCALDLDIYEDD